MSAIVTYPDTYNRFADSAKITLDKINQNGGGGGGGGSSSAAVTAAILAGQQVYYNRNPAAPNNSALDAISFNDDGVITHWKGGGSAWT